MRKVEKGCMWGRYEGDENNKIETLK